MAPLWTMVLTSTGLMRSTRGCVKNQELRVPMYTLDTVETSKKIEIQDLYFIGVLCMSWTFPAINKLVCLFSGNIPCEISLMTEIVTLAQ